MKLRGSHRDGGRTLHHLDGGQLIVKGKMIGTMAATGLVALWRLPDLPLKGRSRAAKREVKP